MSQENVEIVRQFVWAFEHDTDTFIRLAHPEIEWAPFEENHTVFHGVEGAMRVRTGWLETWAEHHIAIEEVLQADEDLVFTLHLTARGKGSGVEADVRLYLHIKVRERKVIYVFEHEDRAE